MLDIKVGEKKSFRILGYLLKPIIKIWQFEKKKKKSSKSSEFGQFFSHEKSF